MFYIDALLLRDEVDGKALPIYGERMCKLSGGKNDRNQYGHFYGGQLEDLLHMIDERKFYETYNRGKPTLSDEAKLRFMQRFGQPEMRKEAKFDKFLALSRHLDKFPKCIVTMRNHYVNASIEKLLSWSYVHFRNPRLYSGYISEAALISIVHLIHAGDLTSYKEVNERVTLLIGRNALMVL